MDPEIKTACFDVYVLIMKLDKHLSHIYKGIFIQKRDTSNKIENFIYVYDFIQQSSKISKKTVEVTFRSLHFCTDNITIYVQTLVFMSVYIYIVFGYGVLYLNDGYGQSTVEPVLSRQ